MPNLRFEVVNAITDRLPTGDIVCLRQVLQHLNNAQVSGITRKLRQYQQWIVTEALPGSSRFAPNVDKPTDERTRLGLNSGVVLTAPPFNVRPLSEKVICEVPEYGGVVRTVLYQF